MNDRHIILKYSLWGNDYITQYKCAYKYVIKNHIKVLDQTRTIGRHSKLRPVTSFQMKTVICVYWTHYLHAIYPMAQTHQTQTHRTHFTDTPKLQ